MNFTNITDRLARHATARYRTRPISQIDGVVIHHTTGSPTSAGTTAEAIANFHVNRRGWAGIGYHWFVDADGTILQTQEHETISFHAGNPNRSTIGIVLRGDFTRLHPTPAQQHSLVELLGRLQRSFELNIRHIAGHGQYPGATASACPGRSQAEWLPRLIALSRGETSAPTPIPAPTAPVTPAPDPSVTPSPPDVTPATHGRVRADLLWGRIEPVFANDARRVLLRRGEVVELTNETAFEASSQITWQKVKLPAQEIWVSQNFIEKFTS